MMKFWSKAFLATLAAALSASVSADETTLSIRTLALEKGDIPEWHVQVGEDKFEKLDWRDSQPSPVITAQAGKELQLFEKGTNEDGETQYKPTRKVALPEAATELLLLGFPAGDKKEAELVAIADTLKKAEFNDWLVINLSEHLVTLRFGKDNDPIELEAGKSGIYKVKEASDKGAEVIAEAKIENGEMRKIYSTFWSASAKQRSLVLFMTDNDRVKVRRIIDFLPVE